MDAVAVSLAASLRLAMISGWQMLRMAVVFGGFQFFMPLLGWLLGSKAQVFIAAYDHWLAFALLVLVAGRMLKEAWDSRRQKEEQPLRFDPSQGWPLLILGLATSLDALAVGLSLAFLNLDIWLPAVVIGLVCFILTILALRLGRLLRRRSWAGQPGHKAGALGGLVLLLIAFKILYEHGVF
jgi:putative Mn2+ efflux pump MntP